MPVSESFFLCFKQKTRIVSLTAEMLVDNIKQKQISKSFNLAIYHVPEYYIASMPRHKFLYQHCQQWRYL